MPAATRDPGSRILIMARQAVKFNAGFFDDESVSAILRRQQVIKHVL